MEPSLEQAASYLETLPGAPDETTLVLKLKGKFPSADQQIVSLAVETYLGRRAAPDRLGEWSKGGFFSKSLLEQASREAIARHRAERFRGLGHVLEIGSGTGSDTAALAAVCEHVTTVDADPVASDLARRNLSLRGVKNVSFVVGGAEDVVPTLAGPFDGLYADPARRTKQGVRVKDAAEYLPPLDFLMTLPVGQVRAIKVSPGLFIEPVDQGWTREFIGISSECLEQTLWFGGGPGDLTASRADENVSWTPSERQVPLVVVATELSGYLFEPHGVVNRTGRVAEFLAELPAAQIAGDVPLGVSSLEATPSPLCAVFGILEAFPYQVKRLRTALAERGWSNRTEFKKRNFPFEPEEVRGAVKLPAHAHGLPFGVVYLLRWQGKPWVVVCKRL